MPWVSRFYGIVIEIHYNDHLPPHFHAAYGGDKAVFDIGTGRLTVGRLPRRARGMVEEWAGQHLDELRVGWQRAAAGLEPPKIAPLP